MTQAVEHLPNEHEALSSKTKAQYHQEKNVHSKGKKKRIESESQQQDLVKEITTWRVVSLR
jgi:hypothetical protein